MPPDRSAGGIALASIPPIPPDLRDAPTGGTLALDLSSVVGWAYGLSEKAAVPACGVWPLAIVGGEGARYVSFENVLIPLMERLAPTKLLLEAPLPLPAQNNWRAATQQFGLRAIAYAEGYRASAAVSEIDALTARAEVMGMRRQSRDRVKVEVVTFCKRRGWKLPKSHHAHHAGDALVIWEWFRMRTCSIPPVAGALWAL